MNDKIEDRLRLKTLVGQAVSNDKHELLGHIIDAEIVPQDGRVCFIELLLQGSKSRSVFVPWSQLRFSPGMRIRAPFTYGFLRSISKPRLTD